MNKYKKIAVEGATISTKGAIGAIPFFGTFINEATFGAYEKRQQERVNKVVQDMHDQLSQLMEQDVVTKEYLESEEFYILIEACLVRIKRNRLDEVMTRIKEAFLTQVVNPSPTHYINILMDLVEVITEKQIEIMVKHRQFKKIRFQYEYLEKLGQNISSEERAKMHIRADFREPNHYNLSNQEYEFLMLVLVNKGLMVDVGSGAMSGGPLWLFEITELGNYFLDFLRINTKNPIG